MKLVNEKGKLFGLVNPVDLIILVVAVAIIGALGVRLFGNQVANTVAPPVKLTAEVVIVGTPPRMIAEIERQEMVGEKLVSGNEYTGAEIKKVWEEPYVMQIPTDDGRIVDATDPSKKDMVFLIETEIPRDTASPKVGSQELRAGKTFILKTRTFESIGTIRYVNIAD